MKKQRRSKEELVQAFRDAAVRHFEATLSGDYRKANREARIVSGTFRELKTVGEEGYLALMELLREENKVVSTAAAAYLLRFATEAAKSVLEANAQDRGLLGFGAQQALDRWQEGDWHLDE